MRVLIATSRTQGQHSGDFFWATNGELVTPTSPCLHFPVDKRNARGRRWVCRDHGESDRLRNMTRDRRRAKNGTTSDGITDEQIYARDQWQCLMPVCLCPDGRTIQQNTASSNPWSRSIDHIVPRFIYTDERQTNKRAAHLRCNIA